jgi:hypothetical protein
MAGVEDDNLLLRVVYGVYDPIVPHANPVEVLLPPLNLRMPNGRGVSERASILWKIRESTSRGNAAISLCLP